MIDMHTKVTKQRSKKNPGPYYAYSSASAMSSPISWLLRMTGDEPLVKPLAKAASAACLEATLVYVGVGS